MFCKNCGSQIPDGSKFCVKCGASTGLQAAAPLPEAPETPKGTEKKEQTESAKEKHGRKRLIIFLSTVLLLSCAVGGTFFTKNIIAQKNYNEQLSLGEKYLEDLEYEAAIAAFKAAIEIEPNQEAAYLGLAEAYLGIGEYEKAIRVLEDGLERTGSERIRERLEELQADWEDEQAGNTEEKTIEEAAAVPAEEQMPVDITVRQVDNSKFPEVTFYASVTQQDGETVKNLDQEDFDIKEIDSMGNVKEAQLEDVYQVMAADHISLNLVLDSSGSMDGSNKIGQAKSAATSFVEKVNLEKGDSVEIISFDDFVYLDQEFTRDQDTLNQAINNITLGGSTALFDALYAAILQTYYESGSKCVIAFTDGEENASSYTFNDVVNMAQSTGIPVFIIGIGSSYGYDELSELAQQCSGRYYSASASDLETILEDIYLQIYQEQQDYYVFRYTSPDQDTTDGTRRISVSAKDTAGISGTYEKEYIPVADLNGGFSASYADQDFMIADSDVRQIMESDLAGMSLAQLRIARNEIFARHGRQFKDLMLNKWFYSKTWYLNIGDKYSPDDFDSIAPSPLSKLEIDNVEFIKSYEDQLILTQAIYPEAASTVLSDYDLCLSKEVLRTALEQVRHYSSTPVLEQNIKLIQEAIEQNEINY